MSLLLVISKIEKNNPYVSFILGDFKGTNTNGSIYDYQRIQVDQIAK